MWWIAALAGAASLVAALGWLLVIAFRAANIGNRLSRLSHHPTLAAARALPAALRPLADVPERIGLVRANVVRLAAEIAGITVACARTANAFRTVSGAWQDLLRIIPLDRT